MPNESNATTTAAVPPTEKQKEYTVALKGLEKKLLNLITWLDDMGANFASWVGCFTAATFTANARSTGRVEAENAVIKGSTISANKLMTITELTKRIFKYVVFIANEQSLKENERRDYTKLQTEAAKATLGNKVSNWSSSYFDNAKSFVLYKTYLVLIETHVSSKTYTHVK